MGALLLPGDYFCGPHIFTGLKYTGASVRGQAHFPVVQCIGVQYAVLVWTALSFQLSVDAGVEKGMRKGWLQSGEAANLNKRTVGEVDPSLDSSQLSIYVGDEKRIRKGWLQSEEDANLNKRPVGEVDPSLDCSQISALHRCWS